MRISSLLLITMSLSLPDRALLVKLFYQNDNSAVVALRKFRTLKRMRKGPLTVKDLQIVVAKFENTGSFNVSRGRGRKPVSVDRIEEVAHQVQEDKAINVHASTIICRVAAFGLTPRSLAKIHCVVCPTLNTSHSHILSCGRRSGYTAFNCIEYHTVYFAVLSV